MSFFKSLVNDSSLDLECFSDFNPEISSHLRTKDCCVIDPYYFNLFLVCFSDLQFIRNQQNSNDRLMHFESLENFRQSIVLSY